jgi:metal-responsive CopG/Arc/MetJ family transcriptional regulator
MPRPARKNRIDVRATEEDVAQLEELARLVSPEGEPNKSLAIRVAVREALERRRKAAKAAR